MLKLKDLESKMAKLKEQNRNKQQYYSQEISKIENTTDLERLKIESITEKIEKFKNTISKSVYYLNIRPKIKLLKFQQKEKFTSNISLNI